MIVVDRAGYAWRHRWGGVLVDPDLYRDFHRACSPVLAGIPYSYTTYHSR